MLLLRLVEHQPNSILVLIPNELMFCIFSFLPFEQQKQQKQ
jgi:preprotein translocase subunit YajC